MQLITLYGVREIDLFEMQTVVDCWVWLGKYTTEFTSLSLKAITEINPNSFHIR